MSKTFNPFVQMIVHLALILGGIGAMAAVAVNFGALVQLAVVLVSLFVVAYVTRPAVRGPPARSFWATQAGASTAQFVGIFFAVLIVVIGIYLAEPILDAGAAIMGHSNIASFPLVTVVVQFLPVVYVVGLFGLAGAIGVASWRRA